jgi:hypothetical protein
MENGQWKGVGANAPFRLIIIILIAFTSVANSFYQRFHEKNQQTSLLSHLFGSIAGLLIGIAALKKIGKKAFYSKAVLWSTGCSLYMVIVFFFVVYKLFK